MNNFISFYPFLCFVTFITFAASEDSSAQRLPPLIPDDFVQPQNEVIKLPMQVEGSDNVRKEYLSNNGVQQFQPSSQNDSLKDENKITGAFTSSKPSFPNVEPGGTGLPQIFIDSESDPYPKDINKNDPVEGQLNKYNDLSTITSQSPNAASVGDGKNENTGTEDATVTSVKGEDDWFDEEEYYDATNGETGKEDDETVPVNEKGNDDEDEEYDATLWKENDDESEKVWDSSIPDNQDDFDTAKNPFIEDVVDENLIKKNRVPTAPTSMVLFYTWMIVAVLIFVVGISMYQSRCKGVRLTGVWAPSSGSDRKRLLDHEFV